MILKGITIHGILKKNEKFSLNFKTKNKQCQIL